MASQFSALCEPFPVEKPQTMAAKPQTLIFRRNWLGCHVISSVKEGLASPKNRFGSSPLSNGT
jgi:hypothetical protein